LGGARQITLVETQFFQPVVGRQNVTAPSRTSTVKKPLDLASASGLPSVTGATA